MVSFLEINRNEALDILIKKLENTFDYISLGSCSHSLASIQFINDNKWTKFCVDTQCSSFDPLIKTAINNYGTIVDWGSVTQIKKKEHYIMKMRFNISECNEGLCISRRINSRNFFILELGTKGSFASFHENYIYSKNIINNIYNYIKEQLSK